MHKIKNISVVILAAGFSSRMKQAKFSLQFDKDKIFLEKIISEYNKLGCKKIVVVMNSVGISQKNNLGLSFSKNVKIIENKFPERERFFSVQTGIKGLNIDSYAFLQNIDNPFIDQTILLNLLTNKDNAEYIVPTYMGKGGHPILLSKKIQNNIVKENNYNLNLKEYLKKYTRYNLAVENEKILLNINDIHTFNKYFN